MLTQRSIKNSKGLVEFLAQNNVQLSGKSDTLVGELQASLYPAVQKALYAAQDTETESEGGISIQSLFSIVHEGGSGYMENGDYIPSRHDSFTDSYVMDFTTFLRGQVKFAREVVNRHVGQVKESFLEQTNFTPSISAEDCFDFSYITLPSVLTTSFMENEISKVRKELNLSESDFVVIDPTHFSDDENILSYFLTKEDVEFDSAVAELISSVTPESAKAIVLQYSENAGLVSVDNAYTRLINHVVNFLFYRNCYNKETEGVRRAKYLLVMDHYLDRVHTLLNAYKGMIRSGSLVLKTPSMAVTDARNINKIPVMVIEENWNAFTEKGGTIEVLLGALVGQTDELTYKALLDKKESHILQWKSNRAIFSATYMSKALSDAKTYLRVAISDLLRQDEVIEHLKAAKFSVEVKAKNCSQFIEQVCYEDLKDIQRLVLNLVAKVLYSHTSGYDILSTMEELTRTDEDISVKEAAHIATLLYLVDHMAQQIDVVKNG